MKTVVLYDINDRSYECLLLEDVEKLEDEIETLKNKLTEIAYICSYGWTDIQKSRKQIYELACYL